MSRKRKKSLQVVHPDAAGIDVGASFHTVAVRPDRAPQPIREFAAYTDDLHALARWLTECGVTIVAMESTGVYWKPLFEVLVSHGFEVYLVNARATKQVSGRKSDVLDCEWIRELMSYGLLSSAFLPADEICVLRSYVRQRERWIRDQARAVRHMQKALTQMNLT